MDAIRAFLPVHVNVSDLCAECIAIDGAGRAMAVIMPLIE